VFSRAEAPGPYLLFNVTSYSVHGSESIPEPVVLHRPFSRAEAQRHRLMVEERRSQQAATGFAYYLGSNTANRYEDGYLVRDFPIKSLYVEEATPPVDELQTFNAVGLSTLTVSIHGLCTPDSRGGHIVCGCMHACMHNA